mgnify:CR=1 FL=1
MTPTIGIRREDKNKWEKRTPIIPKHVKFLKEKYGIETIVQPSPIRIYNEEEYRNHGAIIKENLEDCKIIFGVKEMPLTFFKKNKTYIFFSHTIKGQEYNMPMLKKMMDLNCNLIDYEKITDEEGRRLVFFGRYAGIAGMIDTLWAYGKRLKWKKINQPFSEIKQTFKYDSLNEAKKHIIKIGKRIEKKGLPDKLNPFIVGFAGYGNVSNGAQEIIDLLPTVEIRPGQIKSIYEEPHENCIYKVVFREEDMVKPLKDKPFNLQEYYSNPESYESIFDKYLPYLNILMNCIYWDKRYPRLVTKKYLKNNFAKDMMLQAIGDISVDVEGAIEGTLKTTSSDMPVFVYNPLTDDIEDGYTSEGIVIMAVDNLPCELPRDSSKAFSDSLLQYIPSIANAEYDKNFKDLHLDSEIKKAVILYHGKLTENYQYMNKFL